MKILTVKERLAWRRIERSLRAEAPRLACLSAQLGGGRCAPTSWVRVIVLAVRSGEPGVLVRAGSVYLGTAFVLIMAGMGTHQTGTVIGGLALVGLLPVLLALLRFSNRGRRS